MALGHNPSAIITYLRHEASTLGNLKYKHNTQLHGCAHSDSVRVIDIDIMHMVVEVSQIMILVNRLHLDPPILF